MLIGILSIFATNVQAGWICTGYYDAGGCNVPVARIVTVTKNEIKRTDN